MVPGAGLEPARSRLRGILSPLCLPIPPPGPGDFPAGLNWRLGSESNRRTRLCRPLHNHSATQPAVCDSFPQSKTPRSGSRACLGARSGAGNETRTRDIHVGNVTLYQLSYSRLMEQLYPLVSPCQAQCAAGGSPRRDLSAFAPPAPLSTGAPGAALSGVAVWRLGNLGG